MEEKFKYIYQKLEPLLAGMCSYDASRNKLEKCGGSIDDLKRITAILTEKHVIQGDYSKHTVALCDPAGINSALMDTEYGSLHFDVRMLQNGMPAFYLCRRRYDYWAEYSLVVEDIYASPGYGFSDERFIKLMNFGHEAYFLRLSQFRKGIMDHMQGDWRKESIDDILFNVGRHVFQAAWHEDQRPGYLCSIYFDMEYFRHAIELLYLCLSGELCELRSEADAGMIRFFETVYPQPVIRDFLNLLQELDGAALNDIPKRALRCWGSLSQAFRRFLNTDVAWGNRRIKMPLYKVIFSNFSRLHLVSGALREDAASLAAADRLNRFSLSIAQTLLSGSHHIQQGIVAE
ncbi:MAG: hypothetical protein JXA73_08070 [Acidobacteria bacterium]|nr:hypothetical protein [Acidobacteriota bacterium]